MKPGDRIESVYDATDEGAIHSISPLGKVEVKWDDNTFCDVSPHEVRPVTEGSKS